ncbi:early nodulin-like protein 3 [Oryza brachyantha]|uniref:Phytocyanin domain-containing protein n=1 Tax=Oryza brachyantha TaxID=4533 RepID=J3MGX0_ORYBR|nr:early nodulin-like protein 3 [Oryza brachyantha]
MAGAAASVGVALAWLGLMAAAASATQFRVGGGRGWSVPDANAEPYNSWAGRMRFQIGDQLLFVYPKETDAVLVVDQGAYNACNTSAAATAGGRFDDGRTVFTFDRSGPFFFISGNESNCRAGEKLIVVVMANRSGRHAMPPSPAPAATPSLAPSPAASAPSPSTSSSPAPSVSPMVPAPAATPGSAPPSPGALAPAPAPTTTPSSPPAPAAMAPSPSTTPGGTVPQPPPGTDGANATTPAAPTANDRSGGAPAVVAGALTSLGACIIGFAMLAI